MVRHFLEHLNPIKEANNDDRGGDDSRAIKKGLDLNLRVSPPKLGHSL